MLVVTMPTADGVSRGPLVLDRMTVLVSSTSGLTGMELAWMTRVVESGGPWLRAVSA